MWDASQYLLDAADTALQHIAQWIDIEMHPRDDAETLWEIVIDFAVWVLGHVIFL